MPNSTSQAEQAAHAHTLPADPNAALRELQQNLVDNTAEVTKKQKQVDALNSQIKDMQTIVKELDALNASCKTSLCKLDCLPGITDEVSLDSFQDDAKSQLQMEVDKYVNDVSG